MGDVRVADNDHKSQNTSMGLLIIVIFVALDC
jgi:hypothetical protein